MSRGGNLSAGGGVLGALNHVARERLRLPLDLVRAGVLLHGVAGRTGRTAFHGLSGSGLVRTFAVDPRIFFKVIGAVRSRGRRTFVQDNHSPRHTFRLVVRLRPFPLSKPGPPGRQA